ncbi:MAG: FAD-binding oxidoreductase [Candidatus Methanomethylicia archaeon]
MEYYNRVDEEAIRRIAGIVGEENVLRESFHLLCYVKDFYKPYPRFKPPELIVYPENTAQISEIVKLANEKLIPITPVGGLTGISGCAIPRYGGIVIDLRKMDRIIEIDEENMYVTCEAGITCARLAYELERKGYIPPHFPASRYAATIGGSIAYCGVDGLQMVYGSIGDRISSLKVVLPTGNILNVGGGTSGKIRKSSSSFNLKWLFIGTCGTLGIITEATLRIYPKPNVKDSILIAFNSIDDALKLANEIKKKNLPIACFTVWDEVAVNQHRRMVYGSKIPLSNILVLVDIIGYNSEIYSLLRNEVLKICLSLGGEICSGEVVQYISGYTSDFYSALAATGKGGWGCIDIAIPLINVKKALDKLYSILKTYDVEPLGALILKLDPMYIDFFYRVDEENREKYPIYIKAIREMLKVGLELGGSISHSMGVKIDAKDMIPMELGYGYEILKKIKNILDPRGILNPGIFF